MSGPRFFIYAGDAGDNKLGIVNVPSIGWDVRLSLFFCRKQGVFPEKQGDD
jgi:hypothetical protein